MEIRKHCEPSGHCHADSAAPDAKQGRGRLTFGIRQQLLGVLKKLSFVHPKKSDENGMMTPIHLELGLNVC